MVSGFARGRIHHARHTMKTHMTHDWLGQDAAWMLECLVPELRSALLRGWRSVADCTFGHPHKVSALIGEGRPHPDVRCRRHRLIVSTTLHADQICHSNWPTGSQLHSIGLFLLPCLKHEGAQLKMKMGSASTAAVCQNQAARLGKR